MFIPLPFFVLQALLAAVPAGPVEAAPPAAMPELTAEQNAAIQTAMADVMAELQQRIAQKVRGKPIKSFTYMNAAGDRSFPANYGANDVHVSVQHTTQVGDISWSQARSVPQSVLGLGATVFPNFSDQVQQYSKSYTESFTESYQWTTTETVSVGAKVGVSVGVPEVAGVSGEVSTEVSVSDSRGASVTNERSISDVLNVNVGPNSVIYATMAITPVVIEAEWTGTIMVDGSVLFSGTGGVVPPQGLLNNVLSEQERTFTVRGSFTSKVGRDAKPCTESYPVGGTRAGRCP